jgi:arylsulfatase
MNQKHFEMSKNVLFYAFVFFLTIQKVPAQSVASRPNVIIILTDDQGYGDFSCHGNPILETPAIDKLYQESIRFRNFHVAPLCTPTRGELLTGLDALHNKAETVGTGRDLMRRNIVTMPEVFKRNGYQTGIFGKWHLGENYPDRPMDRGFQKCIWFKGWGLLSEAEYDNDYYKTRYLDSLCTKTSSEYCTDLWFDEAMKWMDAMADKNLPFFVYLPTNAPHGPFYSPKSDYEFYKNKVKDNKTAKFFGMIRNIDQNVDRLEKWLVKRHLAENTVVVLMNDNGGTGGVKVYNAGMRGKKGSNYNGGHRAACFVKWPDGKLGDPRTIPVAAEIQDILPTFVDLLHFKINGISHFDGESLVPILKDSNGKFQDRMFVIQYGGHTRPEKYFACTVWDSWRLVGKNELYDVSKDPAEQKNVSDQFPVVLRKMQSFYENWWKKTVPGLRQFVPIIIGSEQQDSVILTSDHWADSDYVNTQWKVAQAGGPARGGLWHINALKGAKYRLELSRWPIHLHRNLTTEGPEKTIGGKEIRKGRGIPIEVGCVSLNDGIPVTVRKTDSNATQIIIEVQIPAGDNTLRAWFRDGEGQDLCGAYYVLANISDETGNHLKANDK